MRATWENGPASRGSKIIYITSIPYAVNKAQLVERIGDVVLSRKMPHLVDVQGPLDRRRADRARAEGRAPTRTW